MKKNVNGILKEYDTVIYPFYFVAAIGDVEKEVNKVYEPYDGVHNYIGPPVPPATGSTYNVRRKDTKDRCLLVWIPSKEAVRTSTITHECGHAALEIFDKVGAKAEGKNQEPFCYLIGSLARLFTETFYEIPGIQPPKIETSKPSKSKKK